MISLVLWMISALIVCVTLSFAFGALVGAAVRPLRSCRDGEMCAGPPVSRHAKWRSHEPKATRPRGVTPALSWSASDDARPQAGAWRIFSHFDEMAAKAGVHAAGDR